MGRPAPYPAAVDALIVEGYRGGLSMYDLMRRHGGTRDTICRRLKAAGVTLRTKAERQFRLPCREDAFADAAGSEAAAYWAGFLMADGCVSTNGGRGGRHVILALSEVDRGHVEAFRAFLGSDHVIQEIPGRACPTGVSKPCCRLDVVSDRLASDLARYGIVPRKSKTAEAIGLEDNRHFWRGVVDGDGNLRWSVRRNPQHTPRPALQLAGSLPLLTQFAAFAARVIGATGKPHVSHGCHGFALMSGKAAAMISHLYTDCTVALSRKWAIAHALLCGWELRPRRRG